MSAADMMPAADKLPAARESAAAGPGTAAVAAAGSARLSMETLRASLSPSDAEASLARLQALLALRGPVEGVA